MAFYKKGKIEIPNVSGDIVITVTARRSAEDVLQIVWKDGYHCTYTVGSACTVSESSGYYITEQIPVQYGKSYTLNLSAAASSPPRWVGVDAPGKVTETASFSPGSKQFVWTPSQENTVGLRFRGYHDAFSEVSGTTVLVVT